MGMGVAGIILIVGQWIIPENSLRLAQVRYKMMIPNGNHLKKTNLLCGNQTWLAGKSPIDRGSDGKLICN